MASVIVPMVVASTTFFVPAAADPGAEFRRIHFPVAEAVSFSDDFGHPRSGGRTHEGNDLMGKKMQHLLAATDGTVKLARIDNSGNAGNMLTLVDDEGWRYSYIHLNNDTPGTDDNINLPELVFAAGIRAGVRVRAGQHLSFLGDSGNAEDTAPHLHFEIRRPDGTAVNPWTSLRLAQGVPAGTRCGYGTNPTARPSAAAGAGYWVLAADGGVFSFGTAKFHGSTGAIRLNKPVVGMAATPAGDGYWLVASDGGIFSFGDATFMGSTGAIKLNKPIVAMAPMPSGKGYWLVASDGGVFSFGDARFAGSAPGLGVSTTIVSVASTNTGDGYWMLGADGSVFNFGDATFNGSLPRTGLCRWPAGVRLLPTSTGAGYWVQGAEGQIFNFGDAPWHGSLAAAGVKPNAAIIDMAPVGRVPRSTS